jgi:hypothetical protein
LSLLLTACAGQASMAQHAARAVAVALAVAAAAERPWRGARTAQGAGVARCLWGRGAARCWPGLRNGALSVADTPGAAVG